MHPASRNLSDPPAVEFSGGNQSSLPPPVIVDGTDSNPFSAPTPAPASTIQFAPAAADSSSHGQSSLSVELVAVKRPREEGLADRHDKESKKRRVDHAQAQEVDGAQEVEDVPLVAEGPEVSGDVTKNNPQTEKVGDKAVDVTKIPSPSQREGERKEGVTLADGAILKGKEAGDDEGGNARAEKGGVDALGKGMDQSRGMGEKGEDKGKDAGAKEGDILSKKQEGAKKGNILLKKQDTENKSTKQDTDNKTEGTAVKGGEKVAEKRDGKDKGKEAEKAAPSGQDDDLGDEEAPFNLAAMSAFEYEQVAKLNPVQLRRYEQFRRSDLKNGKVKKVLVNLNPILTKASEAYIIAVKGLAKVFVGDVVETAINVKKQLGDKGALQPKHLREAYRRLRKNGQVPSTQEHSPML